MYRITEWCHHFIKQHIQPGDFCIDATMGNGHDTKLLCQLVGTNGKVLAFDIQKLAYDNTLNRLQEAGVPQNYQLVLDSHSHMNQYANANSVNCIIFNFGYLPGGDHNLSTKASSSIAAIEQGLTLLKKGGLMSLCSIPQESAKDNGKNEILHRGVGGLYSASLASSSAVRSS